MTALIAILLYLMALVSPGTYTSTQINDMYLQQQGEIDDIYQNHELFDQIQDRYGEEANQVIVIDTDIQN